MSNENGAVPLWSRARGAAAIALALLLGAGGALKIASPDATVSELARLVRLDAMAWDQVVRVVHVIGVLECATAALVLARRWIGSWWVWVVVLASGFAVFDGARFVAGADPDCGCFGDVTIATEWWHVAAKHVVIAGLVAAFGALPARLSAPRTRQRHPAAEHVRPGAEGAGDEIVTSSAASR